MQPHEGPTVPGGPVDHACVHQPGSIAAAWAGKCLERVVLDTVKVASLACQVERYGVGVLRSIERKAAAVASEKAVTELR